MTELSDDFSENIDRFIVEAMENGCVWGLQSEEGWALCASEDYDDVEVMPLWSQETFVRHHCRDECADYIPVAIELEELVHYLLPLMTEDSWVVGYNWN